MNRTRLIQLLIAKSIFETLLVSAIAIVFFVQVFPPHFRGWGEATQRSIAGWAVNSSSPAAPVQVQLFIDGSFVANGIANQPRPDVAKAGWATDEFHGYEFMLPVLSDGPHEARVYAVHGSGSGKRITLQMLGDAIRFATIGGVTQRVAESKDQSRSQQRWSTPSPIRPCERWRYVKLRQCLLHV